MILLSIVIHINQHIPILTQVLSSIKRDQVCRGVNVSQVLLAQKGLNLRGFYPSRLLIELELRWIYIGIISNNIIPS